jgi:hypothetical protein
MKSMAYVGYLGIEGTLQRIERSEFRFPSLGSAVTIDF